MRSIERLTAELAFLKGAIRTLRMTTPLARHPERIFPLLISELAARYGDAPALLSEREQLSYRELNARANRYARWALSRGIGKGDTVAVLMPGRPEFLALWIGISAAGGVVALLNTNLLGAALAHCINVVSPKHIIVAGELLRKFENARAHIAGDPKVWLHGDVGGFPRIDSEVAGLSGEDLASSERPRLTIDDAALYIYTSGTTGLPKAAKMTHY